MQMSNAGGAWDNAKKYIEIESKAPDDYQNKFQKGSLTNKDGAGIGKKIRFPDGEEVCH